MEKSSSKSASSVIARRQEPTKQSTLIDIAANEKLVAIKIAAESAILRRVAGVIEKFYDKFFVKGYRLKNGLPRIFFKNSRNDESLNIINNTPELWLEYFPIPTKEGNKYNRGHAIIASGGIECTGATKIAARCALRAGAGLVSVACNRESLPVYAASFAAVMTKPVENTSEFTELISDKRVTAVAIGQGAGISTKTKEFVLAGLAQNKNTVIDADGISVFADNARELFSAIKSPCILTPHEGEFSRLFGKLIAENLSREEKAQKAAELSGAIIILKGFNTVIAAPDGRVTVNHNATPYLATAGSGDALTGICTGLLAQKMPAFETACAAVWLHAEAARTFGAGLIAEDIADRLPTVYKNILNR